MVASELNERPLLQVLLCPETLGPEGSFPTTRMQLMESNVPIEHITRVIYKRDENARIVVPGTRFWSDVFY